MINKSPLLVDDIENDDRFGRKSRERYGTKSFLCMPLKGISDVFGVLTISRRQSSQPFTQADAEVLTPLLCNAAFTYDNLALMRENKRQSTLIGTMDQIAKILSSPLVKGDMHQALLDEIHEILPFDTAIVLMREGEATDRVSLLEYKSGIPILLTKGSDYAVEGSLIGKVLQDGNTIQSRDIDRAIPPPGNLELQVAGIQTVVLAPLKMGGRVQESFS